MDDDDEFDMYVDDGMDDQLEDDFDEPTTASPPHKTKTTTTNSTTTQKAPSSSSSSNSASLSPTNNSRARRRSFSSLSTKDLKAQMDSSVRDFIEVTGISEDEAFILLRKWKWAKERLLERFIEQPEKILQEAGLPTIPQNKTIPDQFVCPICLETIKKTANPEISSSFALPCGHRYCLLCWKSYTQRRLEDGGHSGVTESHCPAPNCKCPIPESVFNRFLDSEDQKRRYSDASIRDFVNSDPHLKWCPGLGCGNITKVESISRSSTKPVECCFCNFVYCFACSDVDIGDHRPSTCEQIRKWMEKAADESENIRWLSANTKRCPKCRSPIEKNGGCMTCRKQSGGCGYEFCWLCRGPWSEHGSATGGYYSCNKYDKSSAKQEDLKAADVKSELEHYMFFFHRYDSHKRAQKVAIEQLQHVSTREDELSTKFPRSVSGTGSTDIKFLQEATTSLVECRRTLAFSYVYGFYLDKAAPQRLLFEYLQEDLEKYTNQLSTLYEKSLDTIPDFLLWKEEVTNCTRVTMKFLANFNAGVAAGLNPNSSVSTSH